MMENLKQFAILYLATPYSKYPGGIDLAFRDACKLTGKMLAAGVNVYSPIAHTHPIAIYGGIDPLDHQIWLPFDAAIMSKSDAICVAMMPAWEISYGVKHEIEVFTKAGKPVFYLDPETMRVESVSQEFWTGKDGE